MTSYCGGEGVSGAGKTWRCCSDDSSRHDFEGCREDLVSVNTLVTSRFHCGKKKVLGQQKRSRVSVLFQCSLMVCCLCRVAGCHNLEGMLSFLSGCRLSQFWMVCCLLCRVAGCHSFGWYVVSSIGLQAVTVEVVVFWNPRCPVHMLSALRRVSAACLCVVHGSVISLTFRIAALGRPGQLSWEDTALAMLICH